MKKVTIVYLYSEIMPYQTIVYEALSRMGATVHAFENKDMFLTPFEKPVYEGVNYYLMNEFSKEELLDKVKLLTPDILVVCGWNNAIYKYVASYFRAHSKIPVVCPIDSQYLGTFKQKIGFFISPFYIKKLFTHIWVPGVRQFDFARKLGYDNGHIIMNSLTADTRLFSSAKIDELKFPVYPKRILFVGRYNKVKGLDVLLSAWDKISDKRGWIITLVGNGPMKEDLLGHVGVDVLDFQPQSQLKEIAEHSGLFILPSIYEPWALVLQEFAAAGLPIVCSDTCGASPHCVVNGYNGYTFKSGDVDDLKRRLIKVLNLTDEQLLEFSHHSRNISQFVTPEISAASLLGILY